MNIHIHTANTYDTYMWPRRESNPNFLAALPERRHFLALVLFCIGWCVIVKYLNVRISLFTRAGMMGRYPSFWLQLLPEKVVVIYLRYE
jgi:hypothetical protein